MRTFNTGANRDSDETKFDYEGFLSPLVLNRFAAHMHRHRKQADGKLRDSDNWQKGIPLDAYVKSAWRHFIEFWSLHRGVVGPAENGCPLQLSGDDIEESLCALLFNIQGYLHEIIKTRAMQRVEMTKFFLDASRRELCSKSNAPSTPNTTDRARRTRVARPAKPSGKRAKIA